MKTNIERIKELIKILNNATVEYDKGKPIMSDRRWDGLYYELYNLEQETQCFFANSPTQCVSYQVVNQLEKVEHNHPMLSLQKTKSIDEMLSFIGNKEIIIMQKLDGLTCSLGYDNGKLISAETRGNGLIGENILHNVMAIKNVPKRILFKGKLTIDGEIICKYNDFELFKEEFKHPRNFAAGSIRLLDANESKQRNLSFIAWDVINTLEGKDTLNTKLAYLLELGFDIVPFSIINEFNEDTITMFKDLATCYGNPIDGLVVKYNNCKVYEAAGRTDHHFRGGMAFKFYDEVYKTTLLDIEYTMGRTGVLTPVAIFEPIDIDGTVCERASLHNLSIMEQLSGGFERKGDTLYVFKANDIIPQISTWEHNGEYQEKNHITIPQTCPICGGITVIEQLNDTKVLKCDNDLCEGKLNNKLEHFCGKKGLDIKGLAGTTLEKLIDWGWVNSYEDIFKLYEKKEEWVQKPGFGIRSVERVLSAIETAKTTTLDKFLSAIGIPLIGTAVAKELNKYISTYEEFREKINIKFDFTQYEGFGLQKSNYLLNYDYTQADAVYKYLTIDIPSITYSNNPDLGGKVFVITGRLNNFANREELKSVIEAAGGKVTSSISKNTTALINNDINSTSSKNINAKKLNIPIITEEEFMATYLTL